MTDVLPVVVLEARPQCDDEVDNDRDGRVDIVDPECAGDPWAPRNDAGHARLLRSTPMPDLPIRRRLPGLDWMRPITERLTPSVKTIIIAQACIFFFYVFVRQSRELMVDT